MGRRHEHALLHRAQVHHPAGACSGATEDCALRELRNEETRGVAEGTSQVTLWASTPL